LTYWAL